MTEIKRTGLSKVIRDDKRWAKAKKIVAKIGGATFDIAVQILKRIISDQVDKILTTI